MKNSTIDNEDPKVCSLVCVSNGPVLSAFRFERHYFITIAFLPIRQVEAVHIGFSSAECDEPRQRSTACSGSHILSVTIAHFPKGEIQECASHSARRLCTSEYTERRMNETFSRFRPGHGREYYELLPRAVGKGEVASAESGLVAFNFTC